VRFGSRILAGPSGIFSFFYLASKTYGIMKHKFIKRRIEMFKTVDLMITLVRTRQIISMLRKDHKFDIREDLESIKLVMLMVKVSPYSNKQIVKEFLEMHTVSEADVFAKKVS
jgi:hypothetical protein